MVPDTAGSNKLCACSATREQQGARETGQWTTSTLQARRETGIKTCQTRRERTSNPALQIGEWVGAILQSVPAAEGHAYRKDHRHDLGVLLNKKLSNTHGAHRKQPTKCLQTQQQRVSWPVTCLLRYIKALLIAVHSSVDLKHRPHRLCRFAKEHLAIHLKSPGLQDTQHMQGKARTKDQGLKSVSEKTA